MMMANGGTSYEWQFDVDDDVDFAADDGSMSMDIESFFSILDESPPDDCSQSGLVDPSLTIAPYNEPASHIGANEHSQTRDDLSEASASRTVCSSVSSDYETQTVNHGLNKVGPLPDVTTTHMYSWTPGDWATNVVSREISSSNLYDNWEDFSSSSHYDTRGTNFLRSTTATARGGYVGASDCNIDHQLVDKSGISDGTFSSDIMYDPNDESSMPYFSNRNESSYQNSGPHHPMMYNKIITSEQHQIHNASSNSESSTDTPANVSTNGSHFTSMLPNRREIISVMEGTCNDSPSVDVMAKYYAKHYAGGRLFIKKGSLHSFSGVDLNSVSRNDLVVKGEQDTEHSTNLFNIRNNSVDDNHYPNVQSPAKSFIQHDFSIMNQQVSMPMLPKVNQQAVTIIDLDEPDISILEDMSVSAPRKPFPIDEKSPIVAQRSLINVPPAQIGYNNARLKANDERFIYRVALQDLSQPKSEAYAPDGALEVPLLRHQRIALSWMVHKETKSMHCFGGILADDQGLGKTISTIALILKERSPPSSVHDAEVKKIETETFNLDDDDEDDDDIDDENYDVTDLNKPKLKSNPCLLKTDGNSIDLKNAKSRPSAGTLVVCPTSVLRQWNDELHSKVSSKASLSILVYHGANRTKDPCELAKYDVVLTTYAIVSMEVPKQPLVDEDEDETKKRCNEFHPVGLSPGKKRKYPPSSSKNSKKGKKGIDNELFESLARPLAKVRWFRVILDEAQSIKNHRTQVARACWGLRAKRRWCLSGTPIQNAIDDLYSYFRFLRYDPYAVYKSFCTTIKVPIQRNPANGYKKLQAVLKTIMLRRTKATLLDGEPIISLPPKTINLRKVEFTPEERDFYCRLESDSRAQFEEYAAAGTVKQNYVNILLMLLRLRQACDHPLLVKGCNSNSEWKSSLEKAKKLPPEKRIRLLNCLEASLAICSICSDPPEDAVVTTCEHVFCNQCILEHLSSDDNHCPSSKCKATLNTSSVFSKSTLRASLGDQNITLDCSGSLKTEVIEPCSSSSGGGSSHIEAAEALDSSKIKAAVEVLHSIAKPSELQTNADKDSIVKVVREKAIVFSQWTRMLDLLEACLKNSSIGYRRLDGTMSVVARDKAVKDFNTLPEVNVMIMSLKAASLGLNMVSACHVLLLDLWWNPTTEDQAIDRAHRIGQTRPVSVLRLTVKDTVEDRILALQQKKREMVSSAFGEDETGSSQTRLTVDDLKYLFQA